MEALNIQDTTYAGEAASLMIVKAVTGADTIDGGNIYVQDGIKKKYTIPKLDVANFIQERQAVPTSQGDVTVSAASLEPQDFMLYLEMNPRDFEQHWFAVQMNPKLLDAELPQTFEAYFMMYILEKLDEFIDGQIWQGRTAYGGSSPITPASVNAPTSASQYKYFDGLIKKALDNTTVIDVSSPVALTSSNILAKMEAARALLPKALLRKFGPMGTKFLLSYEDYEKYEQALIDLTYKGPSPEGVVNGKYKGYNVERIAGIPENTFMVTIAKPTTESNLWLGMNSMEDNQLELKRLQANAELYFCKGLFKMDVQIGWGDQCVLYTTQTA
jgi:hypothetical protein